MRNFGKFLFYLGILGSFFTISFLLLSFIKDFFPYLLWLMGFFILSAFGLYLEERI